MTKYRTINNGHWDYLQYQKTYKLLFWTVIKWDYVWKVYCHPIYGREVHESHLYINALEDCIDSFVKKWPNIEDYFAHANSCQNELWKAYNKHKEEIKARTSKVKYLN